MFVKNLNLGADPNLGDFTVVIYPHCDSTMIF